MSTLEAHLSEYRQHEGGLRRLVATLIRGQQNQDDLIQGLLKRLLGRNKPIDRPFPEWAARTLRSLASNERRRASRMRARETNSAPLRRQSTPDDGEWHAILEERRAELLAIINELPPEPRNLILLRYFRGQEPKDIAKSMGIASNTVRSRLHSALDTLRNRLEANPSGGRDLLLLRMLPLAVPNSPFDCADPDQVEIVLRRVMSTSILNTATAKLLVTAAGLLVLATVAWSILQPSLDSLTPISTAASTLHTHGTTVATSTIPLIPDSRPSPAPILSSPFTAPTTADLLIRTTRHGKPLPHVAVVVEERGPENATRSRREGRTNDRGELLFEDYPAIPVVVHYLNRQTWVEISIDQMTTLDIAVDDGYDINGVVVDEDNNPVRGAEIWLDSYEEWFGEVSTAIADQQGRFQLRGIPGGRRFILARSLDGGFGHAYVTGCDGQALVRTIPCDQPGSKFEVTCVDESGYPICNAAAVAVVEASSCIKDRLVSVRSSTATNHAGHCYFSGFGEGIHEITLQIDGYVTARSSLSITKGPPLQVRLVFRRGTSIRGRVLKPDAVTAQAGALVRLFRDAVDATYSCSEIIDILSRPDGSFIIHDLPEGNYTYEADHEGLLTSATGRFELRSGSTDPLTIILGSGHDLTLNVLDSNGNQMDGLFGFLRASEPWRGYDGDKHLVELSINGAIVVRGLEDGYYDIEINQSTRAIGALLSPVRRTVHTSDREVTLVVGDLIQPSCVIAGIILDEHGKPLSHAPINVLSEPGSLEDRANPRGFTVTDESGAFRMASIYPGKLALKTELPTEELVVLGTKDLQTGEIWDLGTIELATFGRMIISSSARGPTEASIWLSLGISGSRIADSARTLGTPTETFFVAPGAYGIRIGNGRTLREGHLLDAAGRWQLAAPTAPCFVIGPGQVLPIVLPSLPSKPIEVPIVIEGPPLPQGSTLGYAFEVTNSQESSAYGVDTCRFNGLPFTLTENLGIGTYRLRAGVGELRGEVSFSVTEADLERGSLDLKVPLTLTLK